MLEEDGNNLNVVTESIDEETTVVVPKKTTNRVVESVTGTEESGVGEESFDQSLLSGNAGNRITPTLPLSTCITSTRPEYARYFH